MRTQAVSLFKPVHFDHLSKHRMTTLQPFIGIVQGDACGIGLGLMSKLLQKLKAAERNRILIFSDQRIAGDG